MTQKLKLLQSIFRGIPDFFIFGKYKAVKLDAMDAHRLIELMRHDKKNEKGEINFSLLSSIGKCEINKSAKADLVIDSLKYYTEQVKLMK